MATDAAVESLVFEYLSSTPYACSSLKRLNGGTANFVYRGILSSPARLDGEARNTSEVIVKHTTDYVAQNRSFTLDRERCFYEAAMLDALNSFSPVRDTLLSPPLVVKTPRLFHFDRATYTQIMECLPKSMDLKSWLLSPASKEMSRPAATAIGHALGAWLGSFHTWASHERQAGLREQMAKNKSMQMLKNLVNYEQLLGRVEMYPHILTSSRAVFEQVRAHAAEVISSPHTAITDPNEYGLIHGDFWTGNVLIADHTLFVVDWELGQLGLRALDLGQVLAELFEAKHFKDVDTAVWIMQGLVEQYVPLTREMAFGTAVHVGVHLVCFSQVPGWGTEQQVEDVVRIGRDFIVKGWERDEEWFLKEGTLRFLFDREYQV